MITELLFFSMTYEFLNVYLPKQAARSAHTRKQYKIGMSKLFDYVVSLAISPEEFRFADCTYDFLLGYIQYLNEKNLAPSTVNCRIAAIRSYLEYASSRDISLVSIYLAASQVPLQTVPKKQRPVIENSSLPTFLDAPKNNRIGNRDRFILILLYDTAIRVNELIGILVGDVILSSKEPAILIHGKGRKERLVVLSEKAAAHLRAYMAAYHKNSDDPSMPLIYTVIHGKVNPMSERNVERILAKYGAIAREKDPNIPETVYPHMIRRTRATGLYQDDVPIEQIAALLGHESVETTRTYYAKPSREQMKRTMNKGHESTGEASKEWSGKVDAMKKKFGLA